MKKDSLLYDYIIKNFPYAIHLNHTCEYSDKEIKGAMRVLEADFKYFKDADRDFVIQSFACLIKSVNANKAYLEGWDENEFQKKGESWKQYHKMIPEFNRAMQSFKYETNSQLEHGEKIFPIKEVIFKGGKTEEKIVLTGPILAIIKAMFDSFYETLWDSQKDAMKRYSWELYEAYEKFMSEWQILNTEGGTLASQLIRNREENKKRTAINKYKNSTAYNIHLALKALAVSKSSAKIPAFHNRIIGKLLNEVNLFDYYGNSSNSEVRDLINLGNHRG
ncbi:MAG TPA: hypothetical protein PKA77_11325 [Chitinophagaceae bacterium]|jgi:hypothetical protein|nr:hypothetical protein [Chitinophagaceae bacterium]